VTPTGLRERKKQATHHKIQQAALDLFMANGFRDTTVAAIAEAADVAPRTVFLHFPAKEDLLFPDDTRFEEFARRLEQRPDDESALNALRSWIADMLRAREGADEDERRRDWQRRRARRAIIDSDPTLRGRERGHLERTQRVVAAAVARDVGDAPDDLIPQMTASAAVALLTMLDRTRPAGEGATDPGRP
jgi:AcrR family transcriptional regulator